MAIKDNYKSHYSSKFFPNVHLLIFRIFFSKFSKFSKNLYKKKILDLGCGLSGNFSFFKYLKMKAYGVEISKDIVNIIKKKIKQKENIKIGTNDKIPFLKNFFDFIICVHSIYYIDKNKSLDDNFKEVHRVLKKNGYLFFSLPKLNSKHIKFKKIEGYHYRVSGDLYNIRKGVKFGLFKKKKDLVKFASKYFKVIDVGYMNYEYSNLSEFHWWVICKKK